MESAPSNSQIEQQEFEQHPLTRQEYITAIAHFYRGEISRSNTWRLRVDATTNWAVGAAAATIGFSFSNDHSSHLVLIFGAFLVFGLLCIEARRFRIYDVFRARVRRTEENFFGPILTRQLDSPEKRWGDLMASDFLHPRFKMNYWHAMGLRLRRNYLSLFGIILICWLVKIRIDTKGVSAAQGNFISKIDLPYISGWIPLLFMGAFYLLLLTLYLTTRPSGAQESNAWGIGKEMDVWDS